MISKHDPELLYNTLKKHNVGAQDEYARRLPIYETFKWWARRYSAVFRGVVKYVMKIGAKKILDPFMGGGTIVLEAIRQNAHPIGIEINPYPKHQISTLYTVTTHDILQAGKFLMETHEEIWPKIWAVEYKNRKYELIHTIFNREGTKLIEKEHEIYDPQTGKRMFVSADEVTVKHVVDCSFKLPKIPEMQETRRLLTYGFKRFDELMTPRQRATIEQILIKLQNQPGPTQQIVISAIADSTRTLSILAYYSKKYKKIIPGFVIKSYWVPTEPAELNPLSHKQSISGIPLPIGRGNLFSYIRKLYRAKVWGKKHGYFKREPKVFVGDAEEVIQTLNGVDAVITDPPYFDTQSYQDLSAFSLAMLYTGFAYIGKKNMDDYNKLIKDISRKDLNPNNSSVSYFAKLESTFRKLKDKTIPGAPIIFSFHHRDPKIEYAVWKTTEKVFSPIAMYIVPGESSGKLGRGTKKTDLIFYFTNSKNTKPRKIHVFWTLPEDGVSEKESKQIESFLNMVSEKHCIKVIK